MNSVSIEIIKNHLKERGRICPVGIFWSNLVKILKENNHTNLEIQNPLILGGSGASDQEKYDRFMHHLKIANELDLLPIIKSYLDSLNKDSFLHSEQLKCGEPLDNRGYWDEVNDDSEQVKQTILPALDILEKIQKIKPEITDEDQLYNLFWEKKWFDDKIQRGENYLTDLLRDLLDIKEQLQMFSDGEPDLQSFCWDIFHLND